MCPILAGVFAQAREEHDFAVENIFQPLINEQVDAEDSMEKLCKKAEEMADTPGLLRVLDEQMRSSK